MNRIIVRVAFLAVVFVAMAAEAAGITGFKKATLKIYPNQDGGLPEKTISRNEVRFPARILTNRSASGLVKATFEFVKDGKAPVSGWVRYRSVRVDEGLTIDVPGCAAPSKAAAMVSRGVRGLGKGCK